MFCPNCGGESPDGSRFCGLCGQTFETPAFEENPVVAEEPPEQTIAEVAETVEEQSEPMVVEECAPIVDETAPSIEETAPAVELSKPEPVSQQPEQPVYQQPEQPMYQQPQQPIYQQPEQPVYQQPQQPMYQQPEQPVYQQPQQPMYQQPQQPYGAQPAYGQPYAQPRMRAPLDPKKKQAIIIAGVCAAVLAAFLIVLFAAIIPNSGIKGKLRHVWVRDGTASSLTIDLKNNKVINSGETMKITKWSLDGNVLQLDYVNSVWGIEVPLSEKYIVALTTDGNVLLLFDANDYDPDYVDYVMKRTD